MVGIRFARFHLIESGRLANSRSPAKTGLLDASPGQIWCTTGARIGRMHVTVEIATACPDDALDEYEDVVETSYESPRGRLTVVDWASRHVLALPPMPGGPGSYRLRYHLRDMDSGTGDGQGVGRCLLRIWPAAPGLATELKITSECGRFWHPADERTVPVAGTGR
ncbi:hypothetical protein CFN78_21820 [Amycolatopsis antarctica]|uniref:Uncharacterized protein n=1 Tax=Amycolatopsis antarctica TaxID=1854586 RepID=A0A263D0F1_9PSEU|nr:hypothetical protein CFN78_21820 [Amycolatopsis antarctica]